MRSLRLGVAILALVLVAAACSDDGEDGEAVLEEVPETTTTRAAPTTTEDVPVTTPTAAPETPTTTAAPVEEEVPETPATTAAPSVGAAPPPPPSNLKCIAGTRDNELLVEFDALPNPSDILKIRTYLQVDGEPVLTNGEFDVGQVDRGGSNRWAAPVRSVPANVPVKLYATSFNQLGQESGWYSVDGVYTAAGAPCGTTADIVLPPPTCTAGCDEEEGEPGA